ncbi:related to NADP-dependent malic enzyme [Ustilago bromivora]|uniref:Related to NADP-dependent malic enzyme n=1 Tax=Ustilago bromivora TaxID=307758 RepID=A0A1K0GWA3_9BASI|nr:related to NADP-dependent malic enzyme [Ustilago bromivora]
MSPTATGPAPAGVAPISKKAQVTPDDKTTNDPRDSNIHRAIAQHPYGGAANLRDVFTNQDTGFTYERRDQLGLRGLLPPAMQSLNTQVLRVLHQLRSKATPLEKHVMLASLRQTNTRLYYATILANKEEILPLIYTPTVGEACQKFSHIYRRPEGLSISLEDKGKIASIVENWPVPAGSPRIAVITDGSRILGLGDLGWNGQGISIGKLSLYVAGAGIHPRATLPIVVDLGTNNNKILKDPLYLGLRRKRASTEEYIEFMDEVMDALHSRYPNLVIQFEDFTSENAFRFLDRYQNKYPMFNDDIQGTGSVILGGFANAARIASKESARPLHDQRILMAGAGSAAVGVAKQLMSFFIRQGLSEDEARERIYITDSKGLVTKDRGDKLPEHKVFFARDDNSGRQIKDLAEIIDYVKPTAILGLSTVKGTFDETVIRKMAALNQRPIIFPLSNPTDNSECTFEEAVKYTDGKVLFAAGSPFPEIKAENSPTGKRLIPGQGNNFLVFPGIGLCAALCKAGRVTNEMITESALALSDALNDEERAEGRLYPNTERIREISRDIAVRCIQMANKQGVARDAGKTAAMDQEQLSDWVHGEMWTPKYDTPEDQ